jgi:3D-(3,5/4)-trihydroxycyclohexane-1,2-dione acylhydrolase (decyclizing)
MQQVEHFGNPTIIGQRQPSRRSRATGTASRIPEQIIGSLPQAVATMLDPADCGPAFIGLCQDTQEQAFDYPEAFFEPTVHGSVPRPRPDSDRVAEAAQLIKDGASVR